MTPAQYEYVRKVFLEARELNGERRATFLNRACAGSVELRGELDSLLEHEREDAFLDEPALGDWAGLPPPEALGGVASAGENDADAAGRPGRQLPERIGRYAVLDVLGEGGMGIVYLAEQDRPRRRVALKLLKPGSTSPERLRRFEFETEMLNRLEHPGIAQIFDAGMAEGGPTPQPFFVMELVRGPTLSDYAEAQHLDIPQRLRLFITICEIVQHAHQNGVIHRDLKPSNILVNEFGRPKVLDFGVARCIDADAQLMSMQTRSGQLLGTLAYMSPEQLAADSAALDTRSDVYSLGVVLFELLCGERPYETTSSLAAAVRSIQEQPPRRLSSFSRALGGDLETIILHAMEKQPDRRYASAAELAQDLRRFLDHEPIAARRPTPAYQVRKLIARHRGVAALAALLLVSFVGFSIAMTILFAQAEASRKRAQLAEREAEHEARLAQNEARKANRMASSLRNIILSLSAKQGDALSVSVDGEVSVADLLDRCAEQIERELNDEPLAQAELLQLLGNTYVGRNLPDRALAQFERALAIHRAHASAAPLLMAEDLRMMGWVSRERDPEAGESYFQEALGIYQSHPNQERRVADVLRGLAAIHRQRLSFDTAEALYQEAFEIIRNRFGEGDSLAAQLRGSLASLHLSAGRYEWVEAYYTTALEQAESIHGPDHDTTAANWAGLGGVWELTGRLDHAEQAYRAALRIFRANHDELHESFGNCFHRLAHTLAEKDDAVALASLLPQAEQVHAWFVTNSTDPRPISGAKLHVGEILTWLGNAERAEPFLRECLEHRRAAYGPGHFLTHYAAGALAECLAAQGEFEEAEPLLVDAYPVLKTAQGPGAYNTQALVRRSIAHYEARGEQDHVRAWSAELTGGAVGWNTQRSEQVERLLSHTAE